MNPYALTGIIIVQFALISYSIAIITEQRKKEVTTFIMAFLAIGVILDITSTIFMIIGSSRGPFTLHGILGYSSLTGMLIDAIILWRFFRNNPQGTTVSRTAHLFSRAVYIWWIAAYITGALLVAVRHAG
ncbi:MAG: hypothetical protein WCL00_10720 [Bacteroidota bacterium]